MPADKRFDIVDDATVNEQTRSDVVEGLAALTPEQVASAHEAWAAWTENTNELMDDYDEEDEDEDGDGDGFPPGYDEESERFLVKAVTDHATTRHAVLFYEQADQLVSEGDRQLWRDVDERRATLAGDAFNRAAVVNALAALTPEQVQAARDQHDSNTVGDVRADVLGEDHRNVEPGSDLLSAHVRLVEQVAGDEAVWADVEAARSSFKT